MRKHVRYHLERLALYALPDIGGDGNDDLKSERSFDSRQVVENQGRKMSIKDDFSENSQDFLATFDVDDNIVGTPGEEGALLSIANIALLGSDSPTTWLDRYLASQRADLNSDSPSEKHSGEHEKAPRTTTVSGRGNTGPMAGQHNSVEPVVADQNSFDPFLVEMGLIYGCEHEAKRCREVANMLDDLRLTVPEADHQLLFTAHYEIRKCVIQLESISQSSTIYQGRTYLILGHLNIVLPSLSKCLRDIRAYGEDTSKSPTERWRYIHEYLRHDATLSLPVIFSLHAAYVTDLYMLLRNSFLFDPGTLEENKAKIMALREINGIRKKDFSDINSIHSTDS